MQKLILAMILPALLLMAGCKKKEKDEDPEPQKKTEVKQTDRAGTVAIDGVIDDVNDIISNKVGGGSNQRVAAYALPCGVVSIDSTTNSGGGKTYKVRYGAQTPCGYRKKSGEVTFALVNGSHFGLKGAIHSITFTNYKVEVLATNDVVEVNGTILVTNEDGGYIWQTVVDNKTIVHKMRGDLQIKYANGELRGRKYFQLRTWASTNSWAGLNFTVAGDTLVNNVKVSETGRTLDGNYEFFTELHEDMVWKNCGTTFAGPYVLVNGHGRMRVVVPNVPNAYIDVEAGHKWDMATNQASKVLDCSSNAYKITTNIATFSHTQYQLY